MVDHPTIFQDPITNKYTIFAPKRTDRPFQKNVDCPFCPGSAEVPHEFEGIRALPNRYAALHPEATKGPNPAKGVCEVILYSSDHNTPMFDRDVTFVKELIDTWCNRYTALTNKYDYVEYIFPFENYGQEIGVSLNHPHGQLYALPFIPPEIKQKQANLSGSDCIYCTNTDEYYNVTNNDSFTIVVPKYGQWPIQIQIISTRHVNKLNDLQEGEKHDLAKSIKSSLLAITKLYNRQIPYIFSVFQAPVNESDFHLHLEILSPQITETKIKFRAGVETSLDVFINSNDLESFAIWLREQID